MRYAASSTIAGQRRQVGLDPGPQPERLGHLTQPTLQSELVEHGRAQVVRHSPDVGERLRRARVQRVEPVDDHVRVGAHQVA